MVPSRESERALLLRVARQAMVEHGLEPDFPPAALAEAGALSDGAGAARRRRAGPARLPWCSIDNDDSRDLDQLTVADGPIGGMHDDPRAQLPT
jgi:exoribonuclease-2